MDFADDSFYICTELSPRNYVVQKAIQVDKDQVERMVGNFDKSGATTSGTQPPPPPLFPPPPIPYWFTPECREKLLKCETPLQGPSPTTSAHFVQLVAPPPMSMPDLKQQLKAQLEYYFSRENLMTDRYLRCQMDTEQYVPITVIAGFRKITQLTNDYNLILQVLRESNQVEVDPLGEKVRPVSRRCTIILREISEQYRDEVIKMLSGGPRFIELKYGLNDSWYVTYENEETTQNAYLHLQNLDTTFNNKPICARIKAGGPPNSDGAQSSLQERAPSQMTSAPSDSVASEVTFYPSLFELGQVLASYGYVPRATYRPGATVVHVEEEVRTPVATRHNFRNNNNDRYGGHRGNHTPRYDNNGSVPSASMTAAGPSKLTNSDGRKFEQRNNYQQHNNRKFERGGKKNGFNSYYNESRRNRTYEGEIGNAWATREPREEVPIAIRSRTTTIDSSDASSRDGNATPTPCDVVFGDDRVDGGGGSSPGGELGGEVAPPPPPQPPVVSTNRKV